MGLNSIGVNIPDEILKDRKTVGFEGEFSLKPEGNIEGRKITATFRGHNKKLDSLSEAIKKTGLKDGMTISFHHHFRAGDYVMKMVMDEISKLGIRDLTLCASSLTSAHVFLIDYIEDGIITGIETSGVRGKLGEAISKGIMKKPIIIRSHGGRARAIEAGDSKIDIAFLGVPCADEYGNANGIYGKSQCGSLGYAIIDSKYADQVVLITDTMMPYPNVPASISQQDVDYVVCVDEIGDPNGIASGATRFTNDPKELLIAKYAAAVIEASGYLKEGFSIQAGTGGASLAVARFLKEKMQEENITASFGLGGISRQFVDLHEEGFIKTLFDVQSFDLKAVESIGKNNRHVEIDASLYANPYNKGCIANKLDIVILSALEVDKNFNVNVITGSDGFIRGASGGHSDTAAGAKLSMIVAPLVRGRIPTVVDKVNTVITPGDSIDVVVTERGVAINLSNPNNKELKDKLEKNKRIPIFDIEELYEKAILITGKPEAIKYEDRVVGVVEYRDGSIIDVIRKVKED
ncbi:citrate lyase subunit alpha [Clostridium sardiniense]|uniref:citrate lyase subunit alpha n=1 Tax=Clostridium sardiniense TaxID=29369 RepID=UPI00195BC40C|nr:citrate lyase subunit alpha [Clostridium sardiniense]MBM7836071.1 citrate lyase subunit alpha/citrate CoA-transferase [Clostridium sardiniense]